jgi:hypothetical protein
MAFTLIDFGDFDIFAAEADLANSYSYTATAIAFYALGANSAFPGSRAFVLCNGAPSNAINGGVLRKTLSEGTTKFAAGFRITPGTYTGAYASIYPFVVFKNESYSGGVIGLRATTDGALVLSQTVSNISAVELASTGPGVIPFNNEVIDVEIFCDYSSTGRVDVFVNNVLVLTYSGNVAGAYDGEEIKSWLSTGPNYSTNDAYTRLQSWYVGHAESANDRLGAGWDILRPQVDADTADADFDLSAGSDGYALIDEVPVSQSDYITGDADGEVSKFDVSGFTLPPGTAIAGVKFTALSKTTTLAPLKVNSLIDSNGTEAAGTAVSSSVINLAPHEVIAQNNPDGGGAWSEAAVNAMKVGVAAEV